jgi:hypothetical protein
VAAAGTVASPVTDLWFALAFAVVGFILATDVKGVSTILHRNSRGISPWGRNKDLWNGLNPFKLGGWVSLGIAAVILIIAAVQAS